MNLPRYSALYSHFHGCNSSRNLGYLIVLDFEATNFNPWSILPMKKYGKICMDSQKPFVQAIKAFFNTEDPLTVTCTQNTWTALLGSSKTITPIDEESATFQLYATPYFVSDPSIVADYLRGISRQASDLVFSYKNCILYLDAEDLPFPGGCYFGNCRPCTTAMYRICILSKEDKRQVLSVVEEWKERARKDSTIETRLFLTKDTIATPTMIPFQTIENPYLPDDRAVSSGMIQKRLCMENPNFLLHDILNSFYRNHLIIHEGKANPHVLQQLGLIVEWPFRITYEGTRTNSQEQKTFVALSFNGQRPNRVLYIRFPYDVYTEFHEVPATLWTPVYYVNSFLSLPPDVEKVIIDSVVIGYTYKGSFFCFGYPILEGRPAKKSKRNIQYLFQPTILTEEFKVMETFKFDHKFAVNRVLQEGVPFHSWCLTEANNTHEYPSQYRLPQLIMEWLGLFRHKRDNFVDVKVIQLALTLARHKICFKTKIDPNVKTEGDKLLLRDNWIELKMGKSEINFINSIRLDGENEDLEKSTTCVIA